MTCRNLSSILILVSLSFSGCAAFGGSGEADSAGSPSKNENAAPPVDDEVPDVDNCYADEEICPLDEPLQPGLGCFCDGPDGNKIPGSAGQ